MLLIRNYIMKQKGRLVKEMAGVHSCDLLIYLCIYSFSEESPTEPQCNLWWTGRHIARQTDTQAINHHHAYNPHILI